MERGGVLPVLCVCVCARVVVVVGVQKGGSIHATFTEAGLKPRLVSSKSDCGRQLEGEQVYCSSVGRHEFLGGLLFNGNCSACKASNP